MSLNGTSPLAPERAGNGRCPCCGVWLRTRTERRFTIFDGMILVAASAMAFALVRPMIVGGLGNRPVYASYLSALVCGLMTWTPAAPDLAAPKSTPQLAAVIASAWLCGQCRGVGGPDACGSDNRPAGSAPGVASREERRRRDLASATGIVAVGRGPGLFRTEDWPGGDRGLAARFQRASSSVTWLDRSARSGHRRGLDRGLSDRMLFSARFPAKMIHFLEPLDAWSHRRAPDRPRQPPSAGE